MSQSRRHDNIKLVTKYFTGENSFLPLELSQLILQFSGCLKVGKKSLVFVTYKIPHFRGNLMKRIQLKHFSGENVKKGIIRL